MSEHEKNIKEEKTDASQGMSRRAKRRIVSVASVCIVLIGVILLNVIASVLTGRYAGMTADITSNGSFKISDESASLAQNVKKDVKITFLTDKANYESYDTYCKQATSIAEQLSQFSGGKIQVEYK